MKKLLNKKGFTLMEMLIVVAIIVILVAISIPAFSNSLESAKKATDAANLRSAKAAFVSQTLAGATDALPATITDDTYYYDFNQGKFILKTAGDTTKSQGECSHHATDYITIKGNKVVWSGTYTDNCDTVPAT